MAFTKTLATLISKTILAETVSEYVYELADSNTDLLPGQYASIKMADKLRRPYSIVELDGKKVTFIIDIKPGGAASKYFEETKTGDIVEMLYPLGDYFLKESSKPKLFVAAGTGIAPMIPMYKRLEQSSPEVFNNSYLLWGIRTRSDDYLERYLQSNDKVIKCLSRAEIVDFSKNSRKGRVTDVLKLMGFEHPIYDYECYICGFKDMILDTTELLKSMGATEIYAERY